MALQFRRGTAAERIAAGDIPEPGEPWFTSDDGRLYIGDGSTPGGVAVSANALEDLNNITLISEATNTLTDYEITSNVATVSTTTNNGYYEGLEVTIAGSTATILNGTHTIASIVSGSSFTFALSNADVSNTSTDGTVTPKIPNGNVLSWNSSTEEWLDSPVATDVGSLSDVSLESLSDQEILVYNSTSSKWENQTLSVSGLSTRTTASGTTASIADGASANMTITGFKSYMLMSIETSAAAWVTVYTSTAARTADASRNISTDPTPGSGVIAEVITGGATTQKITPAALGFNDESSPTTDIYLKVENASGGTTAITVTLTILKLEA